MQLKQRLAKMCQAIPENSAANKARWAKEDLVRHAKVEAKQAAKREAWLATLPPLLGRHGIGALRSSSGEARSSPMAGG
jgi:hypothetical protein